MSHHLSASLEIRPRVCPASDKSLCASTPRKHCCFRSVDRRQATHSFRPRGFSPPRRFTPLTGLGFIAPRNRIGFVAFPDCAPIKKPTEADNPWWTVILSRNAVHTLRRIPLASSRTASLRPLPPCCSVASRPPKTQVPSNDRSARQQATANSTPNRRDGMGASVLDVRSAHPHWPLPPLSQLDRAHSIACLLPRRGVGLGSPPDAKAPSVKLVSQNRRSCFVPRIPPHNVVCSPPDVSLALPLHVHLVGRSRQTCSQGTVRVCPHIDSNLPPQVEASFSLRWHPKL
jgi:hypothetical protein